MSQCESLFGLGFTYGHPSIRSTISRSAFTGSGLRGCISDAHFPRFLLHFQLYLLISMASVQAAIDWPTSSVALKDIKDSDVIFGRGAKANGLRKGGKYETLMLMRPGNLIEILPVKRLTW